MPSLLNLNIEGTMYKRREYNFASFKKRGKENSLSGRINKKGKIQTTFITNFMHLRYRSIYFPYEKFG